MMPDEEIIALANRVLECGEAAIMDRRRCVIEFENAVLACPRPVDDCLMQQLFPLFPNLNRAYEKYETELEAEFSQKLLNGQIALRQYPLYQRFNTLLSNEVTLLHAEPGEEIAIIGSGPFPISAIILATIFGLRVTAVESIGNSAALSEQVINHLGLGQVIRVECGHGQDLIAGHVRYAILALLARPKEAILSNVFKNYAHCSSVICRTSHGLRQAFYSPTDFAALRSYHVKDTHIASGDQTISSILLERSAQRSPANLLNR